MEYSVPSTVIAISGVEQPDRDTADVSITAARAAQASLLSLSMVDFLLETE